MAPLAGYGNPPQFEISDLKLQPSDPIWPDAVRLVQTYWKQATVLAPEQRRQYLKLFGSRNLANAIGKFKKLNISKWYDILHDKDGDTIFGRLAWSWYLKIATLQDNLPVGYKATIKEIHGRSDIEDFTELYRRIYPVPKETDAVIKIASTSQPADSISKQKNISNLAPSSNQQQNTTAAQKKEDTLPALIIQQDIDLSAGTQLTPTSPKTVQPVETEGWNIGNVVDMLGQVKKRRLSSAPESSPKRVKGNDNELLDEVNQKTTITQKSVDQLRTIVQGQDAKLEEVSAAAEQNKQTLSDMRSELRQFMSAVASTLRDIKERLE
ncbi:hypothetical protein THAR02_01031 [Trichoderma harzianum]|uniref:Uncharacterized protein n=1 Tax=Trichoderma harzianum TaxID=5544 RepID=A0A0G0AQN9_TRIHA|nr:hypothetical protein THAR02_01031 [Trichoderma harzianum]